MAIPNKWIRAVFSEEHWNTEPNPLHIPFNPVLSLKTQVGNGTCGDGEESRMGSEVLSMPTTPKEKSRQRADVFFYILFLYATRWVMTDLLFDLNVHILAWLGALYLVTILALSRRKIVCDLWVSPPEFLSLFLINQKVGFLLLGRPSSAILAPSPSLPPYYQPPYLPGTSTLAQLPAHSPITCPAIFFPAGVAN